MRILIVEDEARFAELLAQVIGEAGFGTVVIARTAAEARQRIGAAAFGLVISDLRLPDGNGLEILSLVRQIEPGTAAILMTAHADVPTAREALRLGVIDYLVKPFRTEELLGLVRQAVGSAPAEDAPRPPGLVGDSQTMRRIHHDVYRAARADATVLLLGESGTGKEAAARAIHAASPRHNGPFIEAHLAALPETLLDSELFGHEKGSFTGAERRHHGLFEQASGGTLLLDEIGELPLHLQPKLLRVVQERRFQRVGGSEPVSVNVRIIAATNRDLRSEVTAGRFREDLYYRLEVFPIRLPPLREHREDIPALVASILVRHGQLRVHDSAMDLLMRHHWPGNVRELKNALERASLCCDGGLILPEHLPEQIRGIAAGTASGPSLDFAATQRRTITEALERAGGNKTRAAQILGITRRRLYSRLKALGLSSSDDGEDEP